MHGGLLKYTTTESDAKDNQSKMPSEEFISDEIDVDEVSFETPVKEIQLMTPAPKQNRFLTPKESVSVSTAYSSEASFSSDFPELDYHKPSLFARNGDKRTVLADFNIKKLIGRGSYGKVFLIERHSNPNEVYAMKCIKKTKIIEEDLMESTSLENEILQETSHPFLMGMEYVF